MRRDSDNITDVQGSACEFGLAVEAFRRRQAITAAPRRPVVCKAVLAVVLSAVAGLRAADLSEAEILTGADDRIETHRKAEALLTILGPDGKALPEGTRLAIEQTRHDFLFGSNIFALGRYPDEKLNAEYARRFAELLNFATLGFYWWNYEPEQGKPRYADTERTVQWCREHNILCKGHPLAWNWVDPPWLPHEPDVAMRLQVQRITDCVNRFQGAIQIWDVVNEATHYDREEPKKKAPILTAAITQAGVPTYLKSTFKAARTANPTAVLIINDYRTDAAFADKVIRHLVDENDRPLYDVIGIQSHQHGGAWSAGQIWKTCERFAAFGKPLHFTETTLVSGKLAGQRGTGPWESTPEGEQRQAEEVARFYTVLFSHPAVEAITWWDFSDLNAWQGAPAGFLRKDMTPKPAYDALKGLIKGRWWTRAEVGVGPGGQARFRGFFGEYRVQAGDADKPMVGRFTIAKSGERARTRTLEVRVK